MFKMFKNLTIGKKIGLGFSMVLAALGVIVAISFVGVGGIVTNAEQVIYGNSLDANMTQKEVDHLNWANKVSALLTDDKITKLEVQTDDHKCGFGKWLYGDTRKEAEANVPGVAPGINALDTGIRYRNFNGALSILGSLFKAEAFSRELAYLAEDPYDYDIGDYLNRHSGVVEVTRCHETVAPVVALAAEYRHRRVQWIGEHVEHLVGDAAARVLHQDDGRDAVLLPGPPVELAHLLRRRRVLRKHCTHLLRY